MDSPRRSWASPAARIALVYLAFAVAWILLSDRLLRWAVPDADAMAWLQTLKGVGFVLASALVIYLITKRYLGRAALTTEQLRQAYDQTLAGWAAALDIRDHSTGQHSERVTALTVELAERLGLCEGDLEDVRRGATLHDIGKIAVPDAILGKRGPLTPEEWEVMRSHPESARRMLSGVGFLESALAIPWCHHERWDGTGYPQGLCGEQIPLSARLFAVVDVFDALTSERTYREPTSVDDALEHVRRESGAHFDPAVVDQFVEMIEAHRADGSLDVGGVLPRPRAM